MTKTNANPYSLEAILAPMPVEEFLRDYYGKKFVHIPGDPDKFPDVMDFDSFARLLNMTSIWSSKSLEVVIDRARVDPRAYCNPAPNRDGQEILQPDPDKVMDYLRQGASLVANDIDALTAGASGIAKGLEQGLNIKAQGNLYYSWKQRQAFASHFDTHDVFAVHLVGEKNWRIYENRVPSPIRHNAFFVSEEFQDKNRGPVVAEITLRPGDLLYLPRGQYHDALASSEGTIHIAFGATGVIGLDFLGAMSDMVVGSEKFRLNFPRPEEGPAALKKHIEMLSAEFAKIAKSPDFLARFAQFQKDFHYKRGGIQIPAIGEDPLYERLVHNAKVARFQNGFGLFRDNNVTPIPPGREKTVAWMLSHRTFTFGELANAFPSETPHSLNELLIQVRRMGLVELAKEA
ncbi:JmjC domain-containing protein [Hwanghaeella sp.]|uniref:JmjC domain-containing protein n=1 Tax=Hwanghaeella sp. TaxID=2605943 RepID=UPI003CCBE30E